MELNETEIERTVHISANYPQTISFNLDSICEHFDIDKKDIVKLYVGRWGKLFIETKDDQVLEFEGHQSEEWKWAISTTFFDKDFNEIIEIDN